MNKNKKVASICILSGVMFLGACGKKEFKPVEIQPVPEKYDYINESIPVIDAIIDTEAEFTYIQTIHDKHWSLKNDYDTLTTKLSVSIGRNKGSDMREEIKYVDSVKESISQFKARIEIIDLPKEYRSKLSSALSAYLESLEHEKVRILEAEKGEVKEETTNKSNEYYKKAQDSNKLAQEAYNEIMSKK